MARIFLSHSSANNAEALALRDWLVAEGWDDLFLNLDPTRGIVAGERWERSLSEAANRCEAVVFLVSRQWLGSRWCQRELGLAAKLNKRIFGVLIEDLPLDDLPAELTASWQVVNLAGGADHRLFRVVRPDTGEESHVTFSSSGLARLKAGLTRAGLDARFFPWPPEDEPDRPPYRGMRSLEAGDAGIFYGREAPTIEALDRLRGLRDGGLKAILVILGASGAGKSSFLRAGLLPRLRRDDRNYVVLPIVRPERAALSGEAGFVRSLEAALRTAGIGQSRAQVRDAVAAGAAAVGPLLRRVAEASAAGSPEDGPAAHPRVVLPVDQGEELFQADGAAEAAAFLALVAALVADPEVRLIAVVTIRSDSYERLQTAPALDGVQQQTLSLPPLPRGAYQTVIEGPALRLRDSGRPLAVEPALTAALLADIEAGGAKDALPLLAFTLERLYLEHGGDGDLRVDEYLSLGGIKGSIEAAVMRAMKSADADPAVPRDPAARLALLRRALIPWLAGMDPETQSPRRRIARLSEIPEEARPLVDHLVAERLLSTDVSRETGETTVEPAHEALLRQWGLLQGWLDEDSAALATLAGIRRASRDWAANDKDAAWLAHAGGRLDDAEAVSRRGDLARFIEPTDRAYLDACRTADNARRDRELAEARKLAESERKVAHRTRLGLVASIVLAVLALGAAIYALIQADEARNQAAIAREQEAVARRKTVEAVHNESVGLAGLSAVAMSEGRVADAVRLALASWPRAGDAERPQLKLALRRLATALPELRQRRVLTSAAPLRMAAFSPDGSRVVAATRDGAAELYDVATGALLLTLRGHGAMLTSAGFSPDGRQVVTTARDRTARLWDASTGAAVRTFDHPADPNAAAFSPDGTRLVTGSSDNAVRVLDPATGAVLLTLTGHADRVQAVAVSPDGNRIASGSADNTARIWDAASGAPVLTLEGHDAPVDTVAFAPDGTRLLTASWDGSARIWDLSTGKEVLAVRVEDDWVKSMLRIIDGNADGMWAAFSPDGARLVTAFADAVPRVWDATTGKEIVALKGHESPVNSAAFSPDGNTVLTASPDRTARLWDVTAGRTEATLVGHTDRVPTVRFSPDGRRIVTASWDMTGRVWDAASGNGLAVLRGHTGKVSGAVFSPDGSRVLTSSWDGTARLFDAASGQPLLVLPGHAETASAAAFSPDGKLIAVASLQNAYVRDAATGQDILTLAGHEAPVMDVAFSPDGTRIVTASDDATARVWNAASGASLLVLRHGGGVNTAVFSADGGAILTASDDGTARVWDAGTGAERIVLDGLGEEVTAAAFSPDGRRVVTTSAWDGAASIWDTATGARILALRASQPIVAAAFAPDGTHLAAALLNSTVRIFDIAALEPGNGLDIACLRLGPDADLAPTRDRHGLGVLAPVCGGNAPAAVDPAKLE